MKNILIGVDYSITSPAITIFDGDSYHCHFFDKNPLNTEVGDFHFVSHLYPGVWKNDTERFDKVSKFLIDEILLKTKGNNVRIGIEDYSFGGNGKVFNLAENTGLFKYKLYINGLDYEAFSPSAIKKTATGKGNAKKDQMYEKWLEVTGIDLYQVLGKKIKSSGNIPAPITDIVDSYFVCSHIKSAS